MIGLGARSYDGFLDLDEITDARALAEPRARAEPRKRSDRHAFADMCAGDMRKRMNDGAVLDRDLLAEHDERFDHHIAAEFGVGAEINRFWRDERDAGIERSLAQPLLCRHFRFGE